MKTIYLGNGNKKFKYETTEELREEAKKYNIHIGADVHIESGVRIGSDVRIESNVNIGSDVNIGSNIRIESNVYIGSDVRIESDVYIGSDVNIGSDVHIGSDVCIDADVYIGSDVNIGSDVHIGSDVCIESNVNIRSNVNGTVLKVAHFNGLYKYSQDYIKTSKNEYIRMGCHTRTIDEWMKDFWNNDSEFPKNSEEGKLRLKAFNTILFYLDKPLLENK